MATLAAYDIRQELVRQGQQEAQVVCYSFGAPRCGNHAFARDYNHMVPDTWSIINDQASFLTAFIMQRYCCAAFASTELHACLSTAKNPC